jgi:predicted dehydrogenase
MDRANTFGDAEDYVKLILTHPNKPLIDIEISCCDAYPQYTYKIQGTRGGLKGDMTKIEWKYYDKTDTPKQVLTKEPLEDMNGEPGYCSEKLSWTELKWEIADAGTFDHAVKRYYDTIYDHLVNGRPLVVIAEQVKQQIDIINQCHLLNPFPALE